MAATQVQLELTAIDGVSAVVKQVTGTVDRLRASYEQLGNVVKGLAALVGAGMFASWIQGSIEALNHMRELSIATGLTAETLSALRRVAKDSGTDLDSVATMVQKLSKNMFEFAETGQGKAAKAFERLGFTQDEVKTGMKDMNSFLPEFAKRLLATGSATEQVAMAQFLLGRSGAQLLPFLHELAEQQKLTGTLTEEQLDQAHAYKKALGELESGTNKLKIQMATGLLPSLLQIVQTFTELKGKQGDATGFFDAFGQAAKWVAGILAGIWLVLKDMMDGLAAWAAAATRIAHGDFAGAGAISSARRVQSTQNYAAGDAMLAKLFGPAPAIAGRKAGTPFASPEEAAATSPATGWTPQMEEMFQARRAAWRESEQMTAAAAKAAEAAARAEEQKNAQLERQAENYRDLLDPMRKIEREQDQINTLLAAGKLTEEEYMRLQLRRTEEARARIVGTAEATDKANSAARDLGITFSSAFEEAIVKGRDLRSVLQGLAQDVLRIFARKTVTEPMAGMLTSGFAALFNSGSASSSLPDAQSVTGPYGGMGTTGFAGGGSFEVGGAGGTDSQLVGFRATPGEMVSVQTPGQQAGGSDTYFIDARGADAAAVARLEARLTTLDNTVERRSVAAWRQAYNRRGYSTALG